MLEEQEWMVQWDDAIIIIISCNSISRIYETHQLKSQVYNFIVILSTPLVLHSFHENNNAILVGNIPIVLITSAVRFELHRRKVLTYYKFRNNWTKVESEIWNIPSSQRKGKKEKVQVKKASPKNKDYLTCCLLSRATEIFLAKL